MNIPDVRDFNLPAVYRVTPTADEYGEWDGTYTVEVLRPTEPDKVVKVTEMTNVSPSEIFVKLGFRVAELDPESLTIGIEQAKLILHEAIEAIGSQTIISADDHKNALLDAANKLGGKSVDEDPAEEAEDEAEEAEAAE